MSSEFDIAVVGMVCRFPGAPDLESYAQLLLEGRDAARSLSEEELRAAGVPERLIADAKYVRVAMPLDGVDLFDAGFFGISPRDAAIMDPQHRHFFECAWHALEHAGHPPARFRERTGGRIGVFAGSGMNGYLVHNLLSNQELFESVGWFLVRHTANDKDFLATRVSYEFDLRGPSLNIQTACSTSLVAIHEAVQHLLNGECELALAGGVTIELPQNHGYLHKEGEILAPDGICRAFEERSAGTIFGSGSGCVVLRRLEDALADGDTIHAVVAGSAVNNDGRRKVSYLAPSVDGHADAVRDALSIAQLSADSIDYVEAHGTGTRVGDPIEVEALSTAFRDSTQASGFCGIGSVKPSIGHLDTAAGIASFLKVVLGLQHETIPATAHFEKANPLIDFASTPFTVVGEPRAWPRGSRPRHAGVSSLGVGGTNAHVIVREAPEQEPSPRAGRLQLLPLSAKAAAPLERARENLAQHLEGEHAPSLADASWTLLEGREAFAHRAVVVARSHADAAEALRDPKRCITHEHDGRTPKTVFLFPGGGAQHPRMAVELYNFEPRFRRHVDRCLELMSEPELVRAAMLPDDAHLEDARKALERPPIGLPALFAIEYALALYLEELGLRGDLMLGHSLGEYTAACLAGVFSLEQALRVIELRGRLMEQVQGGGMLSVEMPTEELEALLQSRFGGHGAALCAQNSPSLNVVSGADAQLDELASVLSEHQIEHKRLRIRVAAHSPLLDPILEEFEAGVAAMQLAPASRPFVSNLSGELVTGTEASNAQYWRRHLREPVRFAAGVSRALQAEGRLFLEIGPGATLSTFVRMHEETRDRRAIIGFLPHPKDGAASDEHVLQSLGRAWMFGADLDTRALLGEGRRRVPLPGYSFERKRHWIDPGTRQQLGEHESNELTRLRFDHFFSELVAVPEAESSDERLSFQRTLLIGADSDFSLELEAALAESGQKIIRAYPPNGQRGSSKKQRRKAKFLTTSVVHEIDFAKRSDWDSILDECTRDLGSLPDQILWLEEDASTAKPETHWQRSFALARSLASREADEVISIQLLGRGYHRVEPDEAVHPELGALLGPLRVLPSEWPSARFGVLGLGDASLAQILESLGLPPHEQGRLLHSDSRLVLERHRREAEQPEEETSLLRHQGCYLITGGLGGVGLTLARAIASSHEAKLVLISRTGLPARDQWERWLELRGEDETGQRIRACMEMEREGARILTIAADVSQAGGLRRAFEAARAEFGQVHGVLHAAGLIDDAPILAKREEEGLRVLAPKLQGARELAELSGDCDFTLLFSSTSALWGLPGQSDYCAANAYLERLGHAQAAGGKLRVAAFGPWRALGMTAEMADTGEERLSVAESRSETLSLLGQRKMIGAGRLLYRRNWSQSEDWQLAGHRLSSGQHVLPGTALLELCVAAARDAFGVRAPQLGHLEIAMPFDVEDAPQELRVRVDGNGGVIEIESGPGESPSLHARAVYEGEARGAAFCVDLEALLKEHPRVSEHAPAVILPGPQSQQVEFGERWRNIALRAFGEQSGVACLELATEFVELDMPQHVVHPALVDSAIGFGLPLHASLHGSPRGPRHETLSDESGLYVPVGCQNLRSFGALPERVYAYVQANPGASEPQELFSFDLVLFDEHGIPLLEIEQFRMLRVQGARFGTEESRPARRTRAAAPATQRPRSAAQRRSQTLIELGLRADEAPEILDRLLRSGPTTTIVSSVDPAAARQYLLTQPELSKATKRGADNNDEAALAPESRPRDEVEVFLHSLWAELLGAKNLGIDDDFFDCGGYSLIAVRLFARVHKHFDVEFELAAIFETPTIRDMAKRIRELRGLDEPSENGLAGTSEAEAEPGSQGSASIRRKPTWRHLIPIRGKGTRPPLWFMHGAGGNVLVFQDLAKHLGAEQPVLALQGRGLDGKESLHETIEDMASAYLAEMRDSGWEGPWYLGGYSGGGVTAFEIARRLRAADEEVPFVALIDSPNPHIPRRGALGRARGQLSGFRRMGPRFAYVFARWWTRHQIKQLRYRRALRSEDPLPPELREFHLLQEFPKAFMRYECRPLDVPLILYRATEQLEIEFDPTRDLGWEPFAKAGLSIIDIEGDHQSVCREPGIAELGQDLLRRMDTYILRNAVS